MSLKFLHIFVETFCFMTALEMHIEVNQSLQKVAANTTRKFLTEEIDWVLNKVQDRFIQQCLRPVETPGAKGRFQVVDQLKQDALKAIIVSGHRITTFKSASDPLERVMAYLPGDYQYLLGDMSHYALMCGDAKTTEAYTENIPLLTLAVTTKANAPFYLTGDLTVGGVNVTIPGSLGIEATYAGYPLKSNVTFLKDFLLSKLIQQGVTAYWEHFGPHYFPNQFILSGSPSLSWDGVDVTSGSVFTHNYLRVNPRTHTTLNQVDNRLLNAYDVHTQLNTPFYTTSYKSPIAELADNILYIYEDKTFTVKAVTISYVRKPQPISLLLGTNCEISTQFHQTICDLAVEYLKGRMETPQGESLIRQDLETRVIL